MSNANIKIDFSTMLKSVKSLEDNVILRENKKTALILEKLCNESVITNDFLDSISLEDIESAIIEVYTPGDLILNMQKSTLVETVIKKTKCVKTEDTEDFF